MHFILCIISIDLIESRNVWAWVLMGIVVLIIIVWMILRRIDRTFGIKRALKQNI